jgi:transcriptional regulator NrdR family protein
MENIKVIKRDGTSEPFNTDKIIRVLNSAGLPESQSEQVVQKITSWINSNHLEIFKSLELKDKILEELEKLNPQIANLYKWYESTKDTVSKK